MMRRRKESPVVTGLIIHEADIYRMAVAGTFDDFWEHFGAAAHALSVSRLTPKPAARPEEPTDAR